MDQHLAQDKNYSLTIEWKSGKTYKTTMNAAN